MSGLFRTLGLAIAILAAPVTAFAQEEIVIGAAVPITGTFAASGVQYHNSLKMAQEDINAAGGINGKKLRIAFEDTQANNTVAVNAFIKLVKQYNPPFIFLPSLSTQNLAMEPEVTKAKIPTLYAGGAVAVHERKSPYMFRIRPPDSLQGSAIAFGVTDVLKKSKPGILYTQDDYGLGAANAVEAILAKSNIQIVGKEAFAPRDNDFSAQLLSLKNKGADVIIAFTYNRDGALILKQRKSLGIDLPYIGGAAIIAPSTLDLVEPGDLEGVYGAGDTVLGESVSPASAEFVRRYNAQFGFRPDPFGAAYYDGAMMIAEGLRKVGTDPEKLRAYLAGIKDYKGVTRTFATDENNNMANGVVLVKFKSGSKDFEVAAHYPAKN